MKYEITNQLASLSRMSHSKSRMDLTLTLSGNVIISFPLFVSAWSRHRSEEKKKVGRNIMKTKSKQKQIKVINNSSKSLICLDFLLKG